MTYNRESHTFDGVDYEDDGNRFPTTKWVEPDTFRKEAGKYFNLPNLAAYYLYVQFNLGVDQLAKNMLVRTWDGVMWWIDLLRRGLPAGVGQQVVPDREV